MDELDPHQSAAVDAGAVDLLIAAGAGSGKTRVLTARFVSAVLGEGAYTSCDPGELLTVTFTEKAAGEVAERIRRALTSAGDAAAARALGDSWISTIHGMCARILRQHALAAGVDPLFHVLDDVEASAIEARAVEIAVGGFLSSDPRAAALLDLYGYEAIVTSAQDVMASVRALGRRVDDVRTLDPHEALARLRACASELWTLATEIARLRQLKTVTTNAAVARSAAETIEAVLEHRTADALASDGGLSARGLRHLPSVEGLDELVDRVSARIDEARASVAQLVVAEHETAFLQFARLLESEYARLKDERGALDFSDLEIEALRLLESRPDIAQEYRSRFVMVMLDEFQDTNVLQARIIAHLSRDNLCTVGDENQSIYRFRHADVEVFRERAREVQDHRRLDVNYRTAPVLLEVLNTLFSHESLLGSAYMPLRSPGGRAVDDARFAGHTRFQARLIDWSDPQGADPSEAEAACIADRVCEFVAAGVAPGQIAVLMRALSGGRGVKVERALSARGVPVFLASGGAFFECPEIIEARAWLRVIDNVRDDAAMIVVLAGRLCNLSAESLAVVRACADAVAEVSGRHRRDVTLWEALADHGLALPGAEARAVARLVAVITEARRRRGTRPLDDTVLQPLLALDADIVLYASGAGGPRAWANILKLARLAAEYETATGGDLGGFLGYLDLRELHATSEQEATLDGEFDAVRVMSIHAAKGLEFPVVVVAGLSGERDVGGIAVERVDGASLLGMKLPTQEGALHTIASECVRAEARAAAEAEAVRLLYVACTRAEQALTVISRTHPLKDADDTLGGRVRQALEAAGAGTLPSGTLGSVGAAEVLLVSPFASGVATPGCGTPDPARSAVPIGVRDEPISAMPAARTPLMPVPGRVSYTGLATYERCPYRFFLTSVVKLPAPPAAQGGDALAFGSAVHAVLERVRAADADVAAPIAAAARAAGLDRASTVRLERAIGAYLSSAVAREILAAERVMREAPIAVPVGRAVLAGAIDVIARNGDSALVVDYKTGTGPLEPEEAKGRYRLQGECYALAAFEDGAQDVRVVFVELERDRETTFAYARSDYDRIVSSVSGIIERIANSEYAPRETYERELCETCPGLGGMCPVTRPSRGAAE